MISIIWPSKWLSLKALGLAVLFNRKGCKIRVLFAGAIVNENYRLAVEQPVASL